MGRGDPPWEPPPYIKWLLGTGDCFRWGWWQELLELKQCAAVHIDLALVIPFAVMLVLLAARAVGWISLRSSEVFLYGICLGLAPTYVFLFWKPGRLDLAILAVIYFGFPVALLFVYGIVRLWRHGGRPASTVTLAVVLLLALMGHGCVHYVSWAGIS